MGEGLKRGWPTRTLKRAARCTGVCGPFGKRPLLVTFGVTFGLPAVSGHLPCRVLWTEHFAVPIVVFTIWILRDPPVYASVFRGAIIRALVDAHPLPDLIPSVYLVIIDAAAVGQINTR